jgi:GrpB-like predicted nucleotidyltransferase (UPF0157 family)
VVEVEHIGSTTVPGLAAKPVIDLMVGVRMLADAPACVEALATISYEYVPKLENEEPLRRILYKMRSGRRTQHIHLVERANVSWWERHLQFCDYLIEHPETAREYARLKYELASRFRDDREAYTDAKTGFISAVVERARA